MFRGEMELLLKQTSEIVHFTFDAQVVLDP